jgi:hypothetical protein
MTFADVARRAASVSATDRDRQITAVVVTEMRQPFGEKLFDVVDHFMHDGQRVEKIDHRFVEACERPQFMIVVRVRQRAYVENIIGVERHAAFKAEGLEHQHEPRIFLLDEAFDPRTQHVRAQIAGVDLMAEFGEARHEFAFAFDCFGERRQQADIGVVRGGAGQRMAAARFGEALNQRLRACAQEQYAHVVGARQVADHRGHFIERSAREAFLAAVGEKVGQLRQKTRRQIVDAVIACVFKRVQGN